MATEPEPELARALSTPRPFRGAAPGRAVGTLKGLALVIGVKGYKYISPLDNTLHDAEDFAELLTTIGFQVLLLMDTTAPDGMVTKNLMKKLRREFLSTLAGMGPANTVVLFFYAGHGAEYDGMQYLLPQDWGGSEDDVNELNWQDGKTLVDEAMCLQETLQQIEDKKPLATLAFLDCCREHVEVRGDIFGAGGLSALPGPAGSLVMYATGKGKLAADGTGSGRNGAFTAALLKHFAAPGVSLEQMVVNVRNEVQAKCGEDQAPESVNKLNVANHCLVPTVG